MDAIPLMFTNGAAPAAPVYVVVFTPAILPVSRSCAVILFRLPELPGRIVATAPVSRDMLFTPIIKGSFPGFRMTP